MKKHRIFIVNDNTWEEHNKVGIAAINDPLAKNPNGKQANAGRQAAIAEISGIRSGDVLFFNRMKSENHPPEILGMFEATSKPYFDSAPLFQEARWVGKKLPFRIEFKYLYNFTKPVNLEEIWALKDKGKIWTLQQSRGDAVGRHACMGITKMEAKLIERLLRVNNIIEGQKIAHQTTSKNKKALPIDFREDKEGRLHYEAVLKALLLEDFADEKHKHIFGDYDDFIPFLPTGAKKEIDILLLKYNGNDILWYQILELKKNRFTIRELQKLIDYEKWFKKRVENPLQIYPIAIASEFNEDVIKFVKKREDYKDRPIRLIKYYFDKKTKNIELEELKLEKTNEL